MGGNGALGFFGRLHSDSRALLMCSVIVMTSMRGMCSRMAVVACANRNRQKTSEQGSA